MHRFTSAHSPALPPPPPPFPEKTSPFFFFSLRSPPRKLWGPNPNFLWPGRAGLRYSCRPCFFLRYCAMRLLFLSWAIPRFLHISMLEWPFGSLSLVLCVFFCFLCSGAKDLKQSCPGPAPAPPRVSVLGFFLLVCSGFYIHRMGMRLALDRRPWEPPIFIFSFQFQVFLFFTVIFWYRLFHALAKYSRLAVFASCFVFFVALSTFRPFCHWSAAVFSRIHQRVLSDFKIDFLFVWIFPVPAPPHPFRATKPLFRVLVPISGNPLCRNLLPVVTLCSSIKAPVCGQTGVPFFFPPSSIV